LLAMTVGQILPWKRAALGPALLRLWWAALAATAVGVTVALGLRVVLPAIGFAGAVWLVLGSFGEIIERVRLFRVPLSVSRARLAGLSLSVWAAAIAHAGMGVTVAGIAGMALASEKITAVAAGETIAFAGYDWTMEGVRAGTGPNYNERIAPIAVHRNGVFIVRLAPARRAFTTQRMETTETSIHTTGFADLYAVLGEERDGKAILRLHYNFLAPWIWIGALIMSFGGFLSIADRRLRIGAPARGGKAGRTSHAVAAE